MLLDPFGNAIGLSQQRARPVAPATLPAMSSLTERLHSPAAERNRGPILAALQALLPAEGLALEIASGSGQHAAHFAAGLPGWTWQPSDADAPALASIAAWCQGLERVRPPLQLDILRTPWAGVPGSVDLVFCANLLHIAPWASCAALMQGAARHLAASGQLLVYGPFLLDEQPTAASNRAFDADLRSRNPAWGLRHLSDVAEQAQAAGLVLQQRLALPANNLLLQWVRAAPAKTAVA